MLRTALALTAAATLVAACGDSSKNAKAGDNTAFMEANEQFRSAWLALVPNPRLVRVAELYADHVHHLRAQTLDKAKVRTVVLKGLKRIAAALAAGDGDATAAAMREHLAEARNAYIAAVGLDRQAADEDGNA